AIEPDTQGASISNEQLRALAHEFKQFTISITGTQPIEKAFVTGGGVKTKELNPKTMESKLKRGLHFCGEIIDVHGYTGGYNITSALVTGRVAGMHAANS
ncbi:MAG TPA: NAD(P)/FAD-dependent oxidoreductase, partial [Savagea sp.]